MSKPVDLAAGTGDSIGQRRLELTQLRGLDASKLAKSKSSTVSQNEQGPNKNRLLPLTRWYFGKAAQREVHRLELPKILFGEGERQAVTLRRPRFGREAPRSRPLVLNDSPEEDPPACEEFYPGLTLPPLVLEISGR